MTPQFIKTESGEELVVLPRRQYDALLAQLGDDAAEDRMAEHLVAEAAVEPRLPAWLGEAIARGENPLRAAREHAGLTQQELAERVQIGQAELNEVERGGKPAAKQIRQRVAAALNVDPEWLRNE